MEFVTAVGAYQRLHSSGNEEKMTRRYHKRLAEYLRWISPGVDFLRPHKVAVSPHGVSAAEAMCAEESRGVILPCREPELLARYQQGKRLRDWHISEWRSGIKDGLFVPSEFIGSLGCDESNVESILS
jgi:hypothetical protein